MSQGFDKVVIKTEGPDTTPGAPGTPSPPTFLLMVSKGHGEEWCRQMGLIVDTVENA